MHDVHCWIVTSWIMYRKLAQAVRKSEFFFLLRALTHQSFIFNLRFLCKLKHKIGQDQCGMFHFRFCFFFIKVYFFGQTKHGLFDFKTS